MAIYASSQSRGTQRVDVPTLGAISVPVAGMAIGQLIVARAGRPNAEPPEPITVQQGPALLQRGASPMASSRSSTSVRRSRAMSRQSRPSCAPSSA